MQSFHNISMISLWDSPSWITIVGRGVKRPRKEEILSSQATTSASVYQNGQSGGGGFTGGLPQSSKSSWTLNTVQWGREAELLQLQRSDTRWCYWVNLHVGLGETILWEKPRFGFGWGSEIWWWNYCTLTEASHTCFVLRMRDKAMLNKWSVNPFSEQSWHAFEVICFYWASAFQWGKLKQCSS